METSPSNWVLSATYNLLFNDTSPPTNKRLFIDTSPLLVILNLSNASAESVLPSEAVKNINSLLVESGSGWEAITLVFWATLITPPKEPHASPGPYPSNWWFVVL